MKHAIVIMSMLIGLMAGLLLGRDKPVTGGGEWRRLPMARVELIELPFATADLVYARSSEGELYGCDAMGMSCWQPVAAPRMGRGGALGAGAPCDRSGPAFQGAGMRPLDIDDCIEHLDRVFERQQLTVTVLDNSGRVWQWSGVSAAPSEAPARVLGGIGALIGLVIGIGLWSALAPRTA
jgi:hypothetical protein